MREISTVEVQFVAGGFSFASIGQTVGSTIGSIGDKLFSLVSGGTSSTALSTSLGNLGNGIGALLDVPVNLVTGVSNSLTNIGKGIVGSVTDLVNGFQSIFA
ncbi:hypothetical protein [Commensalibacter oyaizuii]|uniref:Uncharacterized protein n=1 Tax=Commensalibacter oyaizuii TaxID=3043873 RepID=A0ABT6PY86_9PROT|nr:hypothetical protein [Commensalibacter sp. TBRC 16381]MDI2089818.1 hypothetical protein [Commensalibacter sp. TBRC 16381]